MTVDVTHADVAQKLQIIITRLYGAQHFVCELRRLTGGSASHTWRFGVNDGANTQSMILRIAHPGEQFEGGLDKLQEAAAQSAAFAHGVPVAEILYVLQSADALGEGFIMACLDGETVPQKYLRQEKFADARSRMTKQCGEILARIHAVPVDLLTTLPNQSITQQLTALRTLFDCYHEKLPVFNLAFRWLQQNVPDESRRALVHGDFRSGNLMVTEQGINAVLDWELAHVGDPMEDLGWLCVNSWRFGNSELPVGGFGQRDELYQTYSAASGHTVDPQRVRFWELYGVVKWGVICLYQTYVHLDGKERSIDRAAIGRRVSECEIDICDLLTEVI